jgi:uncharacterized membrane protein YkoI
MMIRCKSGWVAAAGIFSLLGVVSGVRAQEAEIKLDQVPKAVMESARAKFPGIKIREASKETENGKTVFELETTYQNRNMDVTFQEDGTVVVVETRLRENEVPAAAMSAIKDKYPGAKIKRVESVKNGPEVKNEPDYYEFQLTTSDNKSTEVKVDAKGKIKKTEENKEKEEEHEKG